MHFQYFGKISRLQKLVCKCRNQVCRSKVVLWGVLVVVLRAHDFPKWITTSECAEGTKG